MLANFVSGKAQSITNDVERFRRTWTFQLGPFAQHTVEITKNYTLGKVITLIVDGEILVESAAAAIGCDGAEWKCSFKFFGEHVMDFEVFKTNRDGIPLDETDHVKHRRKYMHECKVVLPNDMDFSSAKLFIDGMHFTELPVKVPEREETTVAMDTLALQHMYGITTPYKVDHSAPSGLMAFAQKLIGEPDISREVVKRIGCQLWQNSTASPSVKVQL
jgi:hypothetical protein